MKPVTVKASVNRAPADLYKYLLDIASRPEFGDCLFDQFRLTRIDSSGVGAAARFQFGGLRRDRWADVAIVEAQENQLIRELGSTGRNCRVPLTIEYRLSQQGESTTSVELKLWTEPSKPIDRLREFGQRGWTKRNAKRAIRRFRGILEDAPRANRGQRPTVAGLDIHYVPNP